MTSGTFVPYVVNIVDITRAQEAVVTFSTAHRFVFAEYVSLRVSKPYGMVEANNLRGKVLALTTDSITLDIDTTNFNPFVYPPIGRVVIPAVAVPAGSGVDSALYTPTVILEDAFDNLPPS